MEIAAGDKTKVELDSIYDNKIFSNAVTNNAIQTDSIFDLQLM